MGLLHLTALSLSLLSLLSTLATADTCAAVQGLTNIASYRTPQAPYTTEQHQYWSAACTALEPSCILYPSTARQVAAIIAILAANDEHFAIKSGGHNPNAYFASTAGGPLISTRDLDEIALDPRTGRVRVGPGNRWDAVAAELHGSGWAVVGGRIGNVGVGGLLLGGGLSYLTQQYGWAASSILEVEVVLANGSIVTASKTQHADLFTALKGGGNNFGVVTSFLLQGYRLGQVYGGNLYFNRSAATDAALLDALRDFTEHNTDDKAAIILTASRDGAGVDIWGMFVFYDGPAPPRGTFDAFTAVGPVLDTARTRSYADLMADSNQFVRRGSVYTMATETLPLPAAAHGAAVLGDLHRFWRGVSQPAGVTSIIGYQPFPKRMARVSRAKGGDMLDLDDDVDRIIFEFSYNYVGWQDPARIDRLIKKILSGVRDRVVRWQEKGLLKKGVYLPLFMNDAYHSQDYFGRLRPKNKKLAKDVAAKVDPKGLFKNRTGGFKP
ncbi:hypothetical protein AK830_g10631 [Neonectria ditissima]|uniref:FAD-binding PCMH-type domain-containing protein n=1 Tax=Neonectria ditissima TaxID=78410 RepID=A0A0P7BA32_9HYPO|nr:hypothetical protein AK830_g10631 [Neonectria ditissima]